MTLTSSQKIAIGAVGIGALALAGYGAATLLGKTSRSEFLEMVRERCPNGINYGMMTRGFFPYREWCYPLDDFGAYRIDGEGRDFQEDDRIMLIMSGYGCENPPQLVDCIIFARGKETFEKFPADVCDDALWMIPRK